MKILIILIQKRRKIIDIIKTDKSFNTSKAQKELINIEYLSTFFYMLKAKT